MSTTKPTPAEDRALVAEFVKLVNPDPEFLKSKLHAFDMQIMDLFEDRAEEVEETTGCALDEFKHAYFRCFFIKVGTEVASLTSLGRVDLSKPRVVYSKFRKRAEQDWSRSWLTSVEELRYYSDARWCDPEDCSKYTYCEFPGFNYERDFAKPTAAEMKQIQPLVHHLRNVLCGGNAEVADTTEKILGFKLKHPFEVKKLGKALVFVGAPGTGKTMFFQELFDRAFGSEYCAHGATNRDVTTGFYNTFMQGKFVVQLDDAAGNKSLVQTNRFKQLITEPKMVFRSRGKTEIGENNALFLMTLNFEDADRVPSASGNRRMQFCYVSAKYQHNVSYFARLGQCLETHWRLFANYLLWKVKDVERLSSEAPKESDNSVALIEAKIPTVRPVHASE